MLEAETKMREEAAKLAAVNTKKAEVELEQLKVAQEKAHDAMLADKGNLSKAPEAYDLEQRGIKNAQDRDQLDAFIKAIQAIDALKDGPMKEQLRLAFLSNARELLGPNADRFLPSPPPPLPLPPAA